MEVQRSGTTIDNVKIDYEAGPEMYPTVKKNGVVLKDGTMKWSGTMKQPGMYRLKVTAHVDGKEYVGMCTAAFSPEKIQPTTVNPKDFDEFWQKTLADARKTPLEAKRRLLPERCTEKVNVYEVSFQNIRQGSRTYGILCVPVKPGKYPDLLRVPDAAYVHTTATSGQQSREPSLLRLVFMVFPSQCHNLHTTICSTVVLTATGTIT